MKRVLITDETDTSILEILEKNGLKVDYMPNISRDKLIEIIDKYEALLVRSRTKVDSQVIDRGVNLKVIGRIGVGLDNIDVNYAKSKGIKVINAGDATADSVAELTIGLIITLLRKIDIGIYLYKRGVWGKKQCMGNELKGKTIGIIGFGNIGKRVGKLALAFGMKVLAYDIIKELVTNSGLDVEYVDLDELYSLSDIVTIHVPLLEQTKGMISREEIKKMKQGVILVNTARAEIFDLESIYEGLNSGKIGGLIMDSNLKPDNPYMKKIAGFPNVIITPHIGAQTVEAQKKAVATVAIKVIEILSSD